MVDTPIVESVAKTPKVESPIARTPKVLTLTPSTSKAEIATKTPKAALSSPKAEVIPETS